MSSDSPIALNSPPETTDDNPVTPDTQTAAAPAKTPIGTTPTRKTRRKTRVRMDPVSQISPGPWTFLGTPTSSIPKAPIVPWTTPVRVTPIPRTTPARRTSRISPSSPGPWTFLGTPTSSIPKAKIVPWCTPGRVKSYTAPPFSDIEEELPSTPVPETRKGRYQGGVEIPAHCMHKFRIPKPEPKKLEGTPGNVPLLQSSPGKDKGSTGEKWTLLGFISPCLNGARKLVCCKSS